MQNPKTEAAEKNECAGKLDEAIELILVMKECMEDADEDSPQAFIEAAHDAQERINDALRLALVPLLSSVGR